MNHSVEIVPLKWSGVLDIILSVYEHGDMEGKALAKDELCRMARLADLYADSQEGK